MSTLSCLLGEHALSEFRKRKLARRIAALSGTEPALDARFVYLIESEEALGRNDIVVLQDLLHGEHRESLEEEGLLLVVPRPGTQSPWSTKATDIAHHCGLRAVMRIERGIAYRLPGLASEDRPAVGRVLHDRMTQSVLDIHSTRPGALFQSFRTRRDRCSVRSSVRESRGCVAAEANADHGAGTLPGWRDRLPGRGLTRNWDVTRQRR